jgi:starch-binding outer membrane protein, SusD/RagB family
MILDKLRKTYNKSILVLGFTVFIISSCSDPLDVSPITTYELESYYSNEAQINAALAGVYSSFASSRVYGETLLLFDAGTDESVSRENWTIRTPVNLYVHTATDEDIESSWQQLYTAVHNSNQIIKNLSINNFESQEIVNRYLAEARFLRGFAFLTLTTWWDEIPLRLEPTVDQSSNHVAASKLEDVYLQIINDLTFAANNLLATNDVDYQAGRANSMAAQGLLAKTYLKAAGFPLKAINIGGKNPYEAAKEHCEIIINSGQHNLNPNYKDVFMNYIQGNYDFKESIFEIVFKDFTQSGIRLFGGNIGGSANGLLNGVVTPGEPRSAPKIVPSGAIAELLYDIDNDLRYNWNLPNIAATQQGAILETSLFAFNYSSGKFRRWDLAVPGDIVASNLLTPGYVALENANFSTSGATSINLPIMRYADVLLMFAEASNQISGPTAEAINAIDKVRQRAGLNALSVDNPAGLSSKEAFFNELVDERYRELCMEGNRKFDLIRWGLLGDKLEVLDLAIKNHPDYNENSLEIRGFLRAPNNFDASKHLSLPYPLQEVTINNKLEQKSEW